MSKPSRHHKTALRMYTEYVLFASLYHLTRLLPLNFAYAAAGAIMRLMFVLEHTHSRRTVGNILHAGIASTEEEALKLAKLAYRESAKMLVEVAKEDQLFRQEEFYASAPESTLNYILPERNPDHFDGLILVSAHYGNWELAGGAISRLVGRNLTSLVRSFSNPLIGELFIRHRATSTHFPVDKRKGIRPLLKALGRKEIAALLIDQHATASEGVECEFFGHPARVHMTPALLHLKTGVPIIPGVTTRLPGGNFRFELTAGELIRYTPTGDKERDVAVVTQMCISALEKLIRRHPEQWLWCTRHWLDRERRHAADYANWRPKYPAEGGSDGSAA